jgi:predicted cupin superfamily sugar epimerase
MPSARRDEADAWIQALQLEPHPEGGWYRETYRSAEVIDRAHLPARFGGPRAFSTAIYFLLRRGERSRLHRIASDEVWHLYAGGPLVLALIEPAGGTRRIRLGANPRRGERPQALVPAGCWYGAWLPARVPYALTGGTVAPGFDFGDFELGSRDAMLDRFPWHRTLVERLTPPVAPGRDRAADGRGARPRRATTGSRRAARG